MEKRILTIQDISCVGQCSLTVALPIISACGIETAILPTAVLSTHTAGFKGFTVLPLTDEFPKIAEHWKKENIAFDCVYTGYILKDQMQTVDKIIKEFNKGLKIIDPVMADNGEFYYGFDENFAAEMANLCVEADVILPNLTEAAFLLGEKPVLCGYDKAYVEGLSERLYKKLKVKEIVLTGVSYDKDKLGVAVFDGKTVKYYFSERIKRNFHGTGDIYSSAFTGALLSGLSVFDSAKIAVDFTVDSMRRTLDFAEAHGYGVFFEQALPGLINQIKTRKGAKQ